MNFFKSIWKKIKRLFAKQPLSIEKIIAEETAVLAESIEPSLIYAQIEESSSDFGKKQLINKLARQMVAKEILKHIESSNTVVSENKKNKKKLYELHELRAELQKLEEKKVILRLKYFKIQEVSRVQIDALNRGVEKLLTLLDENKTNNKIELSSYRLSEFEKDYEQLEKLLKGNATIEKHHLRENQKKKQREIFESNIKKELNNLENYINQNKLDDAKQLAMRLSRFIKSDYSKGEKRLKKAISRLNEKELEVFKLRQIQLLKQQQEEADKIRTEKEKQIEQQRIIREQAEEKKRKEELKKIENEKKLNALLSKKFNWREFQKLLLDNGITGFYHFTDSKNIKSIRENGGLFSWYYCDSNRIVIPMPGGSAVSRDNDTKNHKKDFVRVAFNREHPMLFVAQKDGRITNPVWLDIDIEVAYFENTEFSDKNAAAFASYTPNIGKDIVFLEKIRFDILKKAEVMKHYNLSEDEKPFNQAEVLIKTWIPVKYINNLESISL